MRSYVGVGGRIGSGQAAIILSGPVEALIIESMTNAQKLGLSPSTPVGTQVKVTDGFVVSGFGDARDGFYGADASTGAYNKDASTYFYYITGERGDPSYWAFSSIPGIAQAANGSEAFPWLADWSGATPPITLTVPPTVQQLAAPSAAQGGVFVDVLGICSKLGAQSGGKDQFALLSGNDPTAGGIQWNTDRFKIYVTDGTYTYYSLSSVATPDLATNWKNASDDSPAGITVTSVTQSEIVAGLFVANDGATNGSSYVSRPFHGRQYYMGLNGGGSNNMHWDPDYFVWTDDVGLWSDSNVAFPWQGADSHVNHSGATFSRNNVAAESNWTVVP